MPAALLFWGSHIWAGLWYVVKMNDGAQNNGRLILDRQSPALKEALWMVIREAKEADGILAPVTVVGPSQYANLSLRQELGRSGFVNVRFILSPMLAEMLGGAAMARAERGPLTAVLENVLVRRTLNLAGEPLAAVKEHQSTLASARQSFRQLRRVPEKVLGELENSGGVRREVVRLYRSFRQQTALGWYDEEDLAEAAAEEVRSNSAPALPDLGTIVFYLPRALTPGQIELIGALSNRAPCAAILGTTGDELADGPVRELAWHLRSSFGKPRPAGNEIGDTPLLPGEARLHIAPDAHEELRRVIRQIMTNAEAGVPLHRMAVLYRMDQPYGSLVRDELELADIPMSGPDQKSIGDTAVGRTMIGLLRLASALVTENALRRDDVMAWLTGCPIRRPRDMKRRDFSPTRWDAISRRAGVIRGVDQWRTRLNAYADWKQESVSGDLEELTHGQIEGRASDAAVARAALRFVEQLASDIALDRPDGTWGNFCDWGERLLRRYLRRRPFKISPDSDGRSRRIAEEEMNAREKILRALAELKTADRFENKTTLTEFRQAVEESLQATVGHLGVTGRGVFVSNLSAAAGIDFDAIWIVGMIEGAVPPRLHDDPLMPESFWQEAGGQSRFAERTAKERYDFLSAVSASGSRYMSFPVADPESRRRAFPSRWLLEQAEELAGRVVYADDLPKLREQPWLTVASSLESSIATLETPADHHDYNLQRLLVWRGEGTDLSDHPLAQKGPLSGSVRLNQGRASGNLTEFDGNLSEAYGSGSFAPDAFLAPVSATSLERWAVCPFRYFLSNVLRLSALDDPEETKTISALDSGQLVHKILEQFITASQGTGQMPGSGDAWNAAHRQRLLSTAESLFAEFESRGLTGKPLLWEMVKQGIQADLERFLEEDAKLREKFGTTSIMAETRFGSGEAWPEAVDEETGIRFRGVIDRVDFDANGTPALIIDYKTGKSDSYKGQDKDPIDGGSHLQLGVYSLAARHLSGSEKVRAIYWFLTSTGGFRFAPTEPLDISDPSVLIRFREGVSTIVEGIRGGAFPANPGSGTGQDGSPSNCSYCDFNSPMPFQALATLGAKKEQRIIVGLPLASRWCGIGVGGG